jgi:hypothetical protein
MVLLKSIPPGLVDGLPQDDQNAIVAIIGKPVLLVGYDDDGRAELHFDERGVKHYPQLVVPALRGCVRLRVA